MNENIAADVLNLHQKEEADTLCALRTEESLVLQRHMYSFVDGYRQRI